MQTGTLFYVIDESYDYSTLSLIVETASPEVANFILNEYNDEKMRKYIDKESVKNPKRVRQYMDAVNKRYGSKYQTLDMNGNPDTTPLDPSNQNDRHFAIAMRKNEEDNDKIARQNRSTENRFSLNHQRQEEKGPDKIDKNRIDEYFHNAVESGNSNFISKVLNKLELLAANYRKKYENANESGIKKMYHKITTHIAALIQKLTGKLRELGKKYGIDVKLNSMQNSIKQKWNKMKGSLNKNTNSGKAPGSLVPVGSY